MTEPLTVLMDVEDVDKAPYGTVVETVTGTVFHLVPKSTKDYAKEELPARVLRWGKDHYPAKFERIVKTLADMTAEEREECRWMQCQSVLLIENDLKGVIGDICGNSVMIFASNGTSDWEPLDKVVPLLDLPRMVWPGEEAKEPPAVSEWVGRELRTEEDFEDAPVGTIAVAGLIKNRLIATKLTENIWGFLNGSYTSKRMEKEVYDLPFTVVTVVEP